MDHNGPEMSAGIHCLWQLLRTLSLGGLGRAVPTLPQGAASPSPLLPPLSPVARGLTRRTWGAEKAENRGTLFDPLLASPPKGGPRHTLFYHRVGEIYL